MSDYKDEFMFDAEFEFYKVRNLLSRSPRLLREDPILGTDMEPLQLSNEERELLQRLQEQPDAPLGTLAEPTVIRRLVDRRLVLLKA